MCDPDLGTVFQSMIGWHFTVSFFLGYSALFRLTPQQAKHSILWCSSFTIMLPRTKLTPQSAMVTIAGHDDVREQKVKRIRGRWITPPLKFRQVVEYTGKKGSTLYSSTLFAQLSEDVRFGAALKVR